MDRLELRHIRVVVAIARAGSIRAAAAGLRIAQPALVGQLQRIERAAGGPLFTRTRTGVTPTERGARVVEAGAALIADFDRLIADTTARAAESTRADALRVGAMRALDAPTLIAALRELRPEEIEARQLDSLSEGLGLLGSGELDAALLYRFAVPLPEGLRQRDVVAVEPAFVGLAADHPLVSAPEVDLADLADADWVISGADDGTGRLTAFRAACAVAGFVPRVRHRVGDCDGAIALLRSAPVAAVMHPLCMPPTTSGSAR
ncbi:LysR family transcriptional regulator [Actinokineospora soli]|uniref:LysR family transcriptional regulator n=1 Tax=Actinokineospora soli TaxID=1048753 RepID=A0ABW2TVB9_9PSEU